MMLMAGTAAWPGAEENGRKKGKHSLRCCCDICLVLISVQRLPWLPDSVSCPLLLPILPLRPVLPLLHLLLRLMKYAGRTKTLSVVGRVANTKLKYCMNCRNALSHEATTTPPTKVGHCLPTHAVVQLFNKHQQGTWLCIFRPSRPFFLPSFGIPPRHPWHSFWLRLGGAFDVSLGCI